jgi:hypothetical protein
MAGQEQAQEKREKYPIGFVIKPGDPWSYFGKPADLDPNWQVCVGQFYDPNEYPELFAKLGYKHGRKGDQFAVPDKRQEVVTAVGGSNYFQSGNEYPDGYRGDAPGGWPIIRVR